MPFSFEKVLTFSSYSVSSHKLSYWFNWFRKFCLSSKWDFFPPFFSTSSSKFSYLIFLNLVFLCKIYKLLVLLWISGKVHSFFLKFCPKSLSLHLPGFFFNNIVDYSCTMSRAFGFNFINLRKILKSHSASTLVVLNIGCVNISVASSPLLQPIHWKLFPMLAFRHTINKFTRSNKFSVTCMLVNKCKITKCFIAFYKIKSIICKLFKIMIANLDRVETHSEYVSFLKSSSRVAQSPIVLSNAMPNILHDIKVHPNPNVLITAT